MFRKLHNVGTEVIVTVDGEAVRAEVGEPVAAVLLRQSECWTRLNPVTDEKRAPFCMMGVCFDCMAKVDGTSSVQTCLTHVQEGMVIERQTSKRDLSK